MNYGAGVKKDIVNRKREVYAKYVVERILPNNQETEEAVFRLLTMRLNSYLKPEKPKKEKSIKRVLFNSW